MNNNMTYREWESEMGRQLRALRIRKNIDQKQLAEQAGVALNAVKNLESGKGSTLTSLIKVLRALERENWLSTLAPSVSISPLQMLKSNSVRQRVSRNRSTTSV
ncbi:MAG: helix-turn-helix transcriptional regulator [Victivallales bacterium]